MIPTTRMRACLLHLFMVAAVLPILLGIAAHAHPQDNLCQIAPGLQENG